MIPLALGIAAGLGIHLIMTGGASLGAVGRPNRRRTTEVVATWSLDLCRQHNVDVALPDLARMTAPAGIVGFLLGTHLFAATVPAVVAGAATATIPFGLLAARGQRRIEANRDAWPQLIEEIRVLATSVGRSIPQAFFEAGERAPEPLAVAFRTSHREWLLTTDFGRTLDVLKDTLADPTADAVCETLLIANQVGGSDLDKRLQALAEDRIADSSHRKDARAKQAGVRFARRFVLIVPLGMAAVGMTIGSGRAAYATPHGQVAVLCAFALICGCWIWAGRLLKLPDEPRVFTR